jgi:uncharacterized protein YbaP (TraB family)
LIDEGRVLTLLGTLHAGVPGFYPLPGLVGELWRNSDALLIEIDARARQAELVAGFRPRVRLPEGQDLEHWIHPEKLAQARIIFGWDAERWAALRVRQPWWVANFGFQQALSDPAWNARSSLGMEQVLVDEARKRALPVFELEDSQAQIDALAGQPLAHQAAQFERWLDDIVAHGPMWPRLVRAWTRGDAQALAALKTQWWGSPDDSRLRGLYEDAFVRRDAAIARALVRTLNVHQARSPLALVGAFHLVGPGNVLDHLEAMGLTLRRGHDALHYNSGL